MLPRIVRKGVKPNRLRAVRLPCLSFLVYSPQTRFAIGARAVVLLSISGWYAVDAGLFDARSDTEPEFEPVAGHSGESPCNEHFDEAPTLTSLPAIPEPVQKAEFVVTSYWVDMTPEESAVYGNPSQRNGPSRVASRQGTGISRRCWRNLMD